MLLLYAILMKLFIQKENMFIENVKDVKEIEDYRKRLIYSLHYVSVILVKYIDDLRPLQDCNVVNVNDSECTQMSF